MTTEESKYSLEDSRKLLAWFLEMQNLQAKLERAEAELKSITLVAFQAQEMAKEISAKLTKAEKVIEAASNMSQREVDE